MDDLYIFNNGLMTPNTMSGSDQRVFNWSGIFSKHYTVNIITSKAGAERFKGSGFKLYISGRRYLKSNIGLFIVYLSRAFKACLLQRKFKFSNKAVIYSSSDLLADIIPALYMKFTHRQFKLLAGIHLLAPNPIKGFRKLYVRGFTVPSLSNLYYFISQRLILLLLKRYASLVLVSNQADRLFLLKKGFAPQKVLVTYGSYDAEAIKRVAQGTKLYDAAYVGRFHIQKGFPDLLEVWKSVVRKLPDALLVIMGEDISAGNVQSFIRENRLENNIQFLGYVGGEKKYCYLKSSKLLIFPSYYESFGIVALEAMACGLPVVAYDLPLYKEIYPRGMLKAKIGDISGLTALALGLLTNEPLREKLSGDAFKLSKSFSWEKTAEGILERLENG